MQDVLFVESVNPTGEAFKSGIQRDDLLITYNGTKLETTDILISAASSSTSEVNNVELLRNGVCKTVQVKKGALGVSVKSKQIPRADLANAIVTANVNAEAQADRLERARSMIVTTAPMIEGYRVVETIEIISAECAYGMNLFKDLFTGITDVIGGRSGALQNTLRDARRQCMADLKVEALNVGANAVIAVDLDYSEFSGGGKSMLFLVASGTAVKIEKSAA